MSTTPPERDRRPLAVRVYDQLLAVLQADGVHPGEVIPPENDLAARLGVSRTVAREALRLLEEDGILERATDRRRRRLAEARPEAGFAAPLEHLVSGPGPLTATVVRSEIVPSTSWAARFLHLPLGAPVYARETLLFSGGGPVASALELVPSEGASALVPARPEQTLLAELGLTFRRGLQPLVWRLAPGSVLSTRVGLERLPPQAPLGSLTSVLGRRGRPVHLAKYVLRLDVLVLAAGTPDEDDLDQLVPASSWAATVPLV